jgi:rhodanese-related sulfurtransferase
MVTSITAHQAQELLSRGGIDVVDVRDPGEWAGGHLPGARLVPLEDLRTNPQGAALRDGVLFVCAAGVRSQTAARIAAALGVTKIYNLSGGTRAWVRAGLALEHDLGIAV